MFNLVIYLESDSIVVQKLLCQSVPLKPETKKQSYRKCRASSYNYYCGKQVVNNNDSEHTCLRIGEFASKYSETYIKDHLYSESEPVFKDYLEFLFTAINICNCL